MQNNYTKGECLMKWYTNSESSTTNIIHKGGSKSKGNIGNYRSISIVSRLFKAFGYLLNERRIEESANMWAETSKVQKRKRRARRTKQSFTWPFWTSKRRMTQLI